MLPRDYTKLAYLESTGTQYIDTGFVPNQDTRVLARMLMIPNSTSIFAFGARISTTSNNFCFVTSASNAYVTGYNNENKSLTSNYNKTVPFVVDKNKNVTMIDGDIAYTAPTATFTAPKSMTLFAVNNNGTINKGSVRFYYCKIYDNGTLVRDYIPVKNADGVYGMYDLVNDVFYGNLGTGTFLGVELVTSVGQVIDFKYTGAAQSIDLPKGKFLLECWGAQGGYSGGFGGYSYGVLSLTEALTAYCYVGGTAPTVSGYPGGFNGGGKGVYRSYDDDSTYAYGGGGGTDIRLVTDSLYARVIVAGGGAGKTDHGSAITTQCYGGGLTGGCGYSGGGGTQTAGGYPSDTSKSGSFGQGRDSISGTNYNYGCGGGGGGWYGGGANYYSDSSTYYNYAGGGSGYVYTADTAKNYPSGCLLNEAYYLTDAATIGGNQSFLNPETGTTAVGRSGNGYIRITVLDLGKIVPPTNLVAKNVDGRVILRWDAADGATAYCVQQDGVTVLETTKTSCYLTPYPFANTIYSVIATDGEAYSSAVETTLHYILDDVKLVTDRTAADVQFVASLRKKGWAAMTEEERELFLSPLKGSYNASDFNRVEYEAQHLAELLRQLPIELQQYAKSLNVEMQDLFTVPYEPFTLETKYDWTARDIPTPDDAARYLGNVTLLRNTLDYATAVLPKSMEKLTHVGANAIELALENLLVAIDDFRNITQLRIKNTTTAWFYSGEIYGGDF